MAGWRLKKVAQALALSTTMMIYGASAQEATPEITHVDHLGLPQTQAGALQHALDIHDYRAAETILLPEIQTAKQPAYKDKLLLVIAGIYFLNHDDLNAAIAWKKADAITPLPPPLQFSLAMAYIRLGRPEWARLQLQKLAAADTRNALYPYWLGRVDYDTHVYADAIAQFQKAIQLDPAMARAYDNLGLCYLYRNENSLAIQNFERAISLDSHAAHPSPWPHINLASALQVLGKLSDAEAHLHDAIRIDPGIASEHFQLGNVLDGEENPQAALDEYKKAALLDPHYAEPHFALARLYRRLGQNELSHQETQLYLQLHNASAPYSASQ